MHTEAALLCDAAANSNDGKLSVLGAFDTIWTRQTPAVHPNCALAIRLRFEATEEGEHTFRMSMIDPDGRLVGPKFENKFSAKVSPSGDAGTVNFVFNFNGLALPKCGTFHFDVVIDGNLSARIPLYVRPQQKAA